MQFRNSYEEEKELKRLRKLSVAFQGLNKEPPQTHTPGLCSHTRRAHLEPETFSKTSNYEIL